MASRGETKKENKNALDVGSGGFNEELEELEMWRKVASMIGESLESVCNMGQQERDQLLLLVPGDEEDDDNTDMTCDMYDRIKKWNRRSQNLNKAKSDKESKSIKVAGANPKLYSKKSTVISMESEDTLVTNTRMSENIKLKNVRVDLKRCHKSKLNSTNTKTHQDFFLNPHPKSAQDFKNNDRLLACFNDGHSDDMFDHHKAPSRVSQMNLEDSFSDQEPSPGGKPKTPLVNYVRSFEGWAQQTPADLRAEVNKSDTPGQFKYCAFLRRALREKRSKKLFTRSSATKKSSVTNEGFTACLSKLKPALEEAIGSAQSDSEEEMEPYFEDE